MAAHSRQTKRVYESATVDILDLLVRLVAHTHTHCLISCAPPISPLVPTGGSLERILSFTALHHSADGRFRQATCWWTASDGHAPRAILQLQHHSNSALNQSQSRPAFSHPASTAQMQEAAGVKRVTTWNGSQCDEPVTGSDAFQVRSQTRVEPRQGVALCKVLQAHITNSPDKKRATSMCRSRSLCHNLSSVPLHPCANTCLNQVAWMMTLFVLHVTARYTGS